MSSYKYNTRLSSSPKVVGAHIYEHSSSSNSQRNTVKSGIKIKQRTPRSNNIRMQSDIDGYSDSSDSTNCSELSNTSNSINSYHPNRKNSINSYSSRSIGNNSSISKRASINAKRTSISDRPPIPIKNNNIIKKMSVDSSAHDSQILMTASPSDKKLLNISINDQANDRALRKIMDLEILNESLRSINESLECTIKEQNLKMEQLQLQIDHLKSASTLNSTNDDDFLFDFLLTKDTNSDSEIKIIPRHPQHAYRNSNQLSSSIPKSEDVKDNEKLLENINLNEDTDVQFKRICAKLELLINDATKAVGLKPKEVEKELNKEKKPIFDPNDIKIERRHSNINNNESSNDKNSVKVSDSNSTLTEEDVTTSTNSSSNTNEELNNNSDLTKIDEEIINEKVNSKVNNNIISQEIIKNTQSISEIQTKYKKIFNIIEKLNTVSKDVMNESRKFEQIQIHNDNEKNNQNKSRQQNNEEKSNTSNSSSGKGLAMLLNPLLNYQNTINNNDNDNNSIPESSTTKIKELTNSMNNILENLMEVLNEEKQKELKRSKEENQNENITNNNVRCPVIITSGLPADKPNKSGFNRRNSSVTSPKFNRSTSVERSVNINNDGSESMMKINAILSNNGSTVVNSPGYPSILSNIPFKKDNKLFHRTRTWDPQYLNHYRSLSVQTPSSLRNIKSPTLVPSVVATSTSINNSNKTHTNENNNNSSPPTTSTATSSSAPSSSVTSPQNQYVKPSINENEIKFQNFVQGLERKKTHLPSFYL